MPKIPISKSSLRILLLSLSASTFIPAVAHAQNFPGGFIEKSHATTVRTRLKSTAFLPAGRGVFNFPAPYNTQGVRVTIPSDCGGTDCVQAVGYGYWALMNNHVGSGTMHVLLNLQGNGGPTLFSYNKANDAVTKVGPLFASGSPFSYHSTEAWYFSGTQPNKLYLFQSGDTKLQRYDVVNRTFETVFDVASNTALFGTNRIIWQVHSSTDDDVHSFTVRSKPGYSDMGCGVYKQSTGKFSYYPVTGNYDECQVDRTGRWLVIKQDVDGKPANDNLIIDLQTGAQKQLLDPDGAPGHSDSGAGYMVGVDNWAPDGYSIKLWDLSKNPMKGTAVEVYRSADWYSSWPEHISHLNTRAGVPASQQYVCGSGADATNNARGNELQCFRLDGSYNTLIVAPIMTDWSAAGGGDDYSKYPKANIDVTGKYAIWTSNMGGNRLDAFIAKIPSQVLMGGSDPVDPPVDPTDTVKPTVSLTAPAGGAELSCTAVTVSANASDNVGVAGVQFKLDGSDIGAEDTTAPYSTSWNTTSATNGAHSLTAVARDAAGNTTTSSPVGVTVNNAAGTTPPSSPTVEDVVWRALVNASAVNRVLKKNAGCDGCQDAGAVSTQKIASGDGYVEFVANQTGTERAIGLSKGNANTTTADIDFGLVFTGPYVEVREKDAYKADTSYVQGDKFRIAVAGGKVQYSKNGVVFYTSAKAPAYPLLVDTALLSPNAAIQRAVITQGGATPPAQCP